MESLMLIIALKKGVLLSECDKVVKGSLSWNQSHWISMSKINGCQKAGNDLTHIKGTPQKLFTLAYLRLSMTSLLEHSIGQLWHYGLWSFQTGGTKLERFLPKNQDTQRKLLNFEN